MRIHIQHAGFITYTHTHTALLGMLFIFSGFYGVLCSLLVSVYKFEHTHMLINIMAIKQPQREKKNTDMKRHQEIDSNKVRQILFKLFRPCPYGTLHLLSHYCGQ